MHCGDQWYILIRHLYTSFNFFYLLKRPLCHKNSTNECQTQYVTVTGCTFPARLVALMGGLREDSQ